MLNEDLVSLKVMQDEEIRELYLALFQKKIEPYIERAWKWWTEDRMEFMPKLTGSYKINDAPIGLELRFNRLANHSAIKGIQAFPFVPATSIGIAGAKGGLLRLVHAICGLEGIPIKGMQVIQKHSSGPTAYQAQILCFVPVSELQEKHTAKWIPVLQHEMDDVIDYDIIPDTLRRKFVVARDL